MSIEIATRRLTAEALVEMPDDGIERDIIRGEIREHPTTRRNPTHSVTEVNVAHFLKTWL